MEGLKKDAAKLILMYFAILVVALYATGCTNGQLCVGMSEYNQNQESRSFDNKREK